MLSLGPLREALPVLRVLRQAAGPRHLQPVPARLRRRPLQAAIRLRKRPPALQLPQLSGFARPYGGGMTNADIPDVSNGDVIAFGARHGVEALVAPDEDGIPRVWVDE